MTPPVWVSTVEHSSGGRKRRDRHGSSGGASSSPPTYCRWHACRILLVFFVALVSFESIDHASAQTSLISDYVAVTSPTFTAPSKIAKEMRFTMTVKKATSMMKLVIDPATSGYNSVVLDLADGGNSLADNTDLDFTVPSLVTAATDVNEVLAVNAYSSWAAAGNVFMSPGSSASTGSSVSVTDYPSGVTLLFYIHYQCSGCTGRTWEQIEVFSLKTSDVETDPPILTVTNINGVFSSNFEISFTMPEAPLENSIKLKAIPLDGNADPHGVRTIVLSEEFEQQQTSPLTVTGGALSSLTEKFYPENQAVTYFADSVTPNNDLVNNVTYNVTFEYRDTIQNVPAIATVGYLTMDALTEPPVLIQPATGVNGVSKMPVHFDLQFMLPEDPLPNSVEVSITPIGGFAIVDNCSTTSTSVARSIVLTTSAKGTYSIVFLPLEDAETLSEGSTLTNKCNLTHGATYVFKLAYKDAFGNAEASTFLQIIFDSEALDPTIHAPAPNSILRSDFEFNFELHEDGMPGQTKLTATYQTGPNVDTAAARVIVFSNTVRETGTHAVAFDALSGLAATSEDVGMVTPGIDFVHMATYLFELAFQDLATNDAQIQSVTVTFDTQTDAPVISAPAAGEFLKDPFALNFSLPEEASDAGVTIVFTKILSLSSFGFDEEYFPTHTLTVNATSAGFYHLSMGRLSAIVSSNSLVLTSVAYPNGQSAADIDLNEGTIYNVTLSYQDRVLNSASEVSVGLLEFSGDTTAAPVLSSPGPDAAIAAAFPLAFTLPEVPLTGSVKIILTTISGDAQGVRSVSFVQGSSVENRGSHSFSISNFHTAAIDFNEIDAVVPDSPLVDGAIYDLRLEYQDAVGNPANATSSTISFHGSETLGLSFISPSNESCLKTAFNVTFFLPEKALDTSLKLTITPTGGRSDIAGARVIVFANENPGVRTIGGGAFQELSNLAGLADVESVTPNTNLVDGAIYMFTLAYQDAAGNAESTAVLTDVSFSGDTTIDLASRESWILKGTFSGNPALPQNWTFGLRLPERALSGSVTMTLTRVDGPDDFHSPHTVVFGSGFEEPGGTFHRNYTFMGFADYYSYNGGTDVNVYSVLPVNKNLIDGTVYRIVLSYRDCAGNALSSQTRDLITYAGGSTLPPDIIVPNIVGSPIPVSFTLPEIAEPGSVSLVFSPTGGAVDSVGDRTLLLNSNAEYALTYSLQIGDLINLAATLSFYYSSVSPSTNLVDGAVYSITISYADAGGNPVESATASNVLYAGSTTRDPELYAPSSLSVVLETIAIFFNLPEKAYANTLKLIFDDTGGSVDSLAPHTVVLSTGMLDNGNHSFSLGQLSTAASLQSEVASVSM